MKFLIWGIALMPSLAFGCGVSDAIVSGIQRYHDGHIFVHFDKATDCGCSQTKRLVFKEDAPGMDYVKSMVLLAYSSGAPVSAYTTSNSCSVHGNTAVLTTLNLNRK